MASQNTPIHSAPVLNFPTMYGQKSKTQIEAQIASNTNKVDAKSNPGQLRKTSEEKLLEIYNWARTMESKEDVRDMPRAYRLTLLEGPKVDLTCGGEVVGAVPLRMLLATSPTFHKQFLIDQEIPTVRAVHPALRGALVSLVEYLKNTLTKAKCYYLKKTTFEDDIDLILAAESLGLGRYAANIRSIWWIYLRTQPVEKIGFDKLQALETRMVPQTKDFKMTKMLIERLTRQWYHYQIANLTEFDAWMEKLPKMLHAMNEHVDNWDAIRAQKQAASKQRKHEVEKKAYDEQLRAARGGRAGGFGM
ncbi:uncharacterized protein N0V89_001357 [Didymosphaeria variabile]|uniref:BTB domain-containing protein n=1 Tax=Didymosphaeria variabile TaxID=1932322 RepID=A0A9W8XXZ0_9PLEO|nr:uncharacterized protein N0V89_001357 [Didymosphaeria variabile]KAJ4360790.1 hypothetical protein N0V89_001357 [Didymosphaeria variabile]